MIKKVQAYKYLSYLINVSEKEEYTAVRTFGDENLM